MATNEIESTCSNKGTLSEDGDVTLRNADDKTELANADSQDIDNVNEQNSELVTENAELSFDTDPNGDSIRIRKLTEKGLEENVQRLRQKRTNALSAVTRKRTDIKRLMTDRNNVDVVKTEVVQLDRLSQQFHDAHNLYLDALISPEEKENASRHFVGKENDIFEYRKEVVNWILVCEAKINDQLDGLSQVDKQSWRSRSSHTSRSSISVQSARMKEKAKVAELTAERSILNEKLKLQAAEEQLQFDLQIAKAQAREQAFAELEEELKLPARDEECRDSFFAFPRPASDRKHELPPSFVNAPLRLAGVKPELERKEREPQPLNPAAPEFRYRAFPGEIKREIKEETPNVQKSDEELLKEVFKIQQSQIENMISSQQQLATAVTLPQPEVPKFSGDPMKYKTFIMTFDARIQSRVPSDADRLYRKI